MSLIEKTSTLGLAPDTGTYTKPGSRIASKLVNDSTVDDVKPLIGSADPTKYDLYTKDGEEVIEKYQDNLPEDLKWGGTGVVIPKV